MNKAIVYHWWAKTTSGAHSKFEDSPKAYNNLRVPIIPSIAILRSKNNYLPIYVLDCSDRPVDWVIFQKTLNFKVIPWIPYLQKYKNKNGWKYLSKNWRCLQLLGTNTRREEIIYNDSDVFWIKDVLPLLCQTDKFCF